MAIIMCKRCAGGIRYNSDREPDNTPETHSDVNKECKRPYRE